jgi:hypothetical protein
VGVISAQSQGALMRRARFINDDESMSNKEFETKESAMTLLLTKQWRYFTHPSRRNAVLSLLIFFILLVESAAIEAAASFIAHQRYSISDVTCPCSRAKSLIATTIHRTKCISFHTVRCNNQLRRNVLFRLRTQPEDANDDGKDDDSSMDKYHTMSSPQKQQQQQQQQQQQEENYSRSLEEKMDNFLDQEFFNPSSVDQNSPLKWFANLVERDYETAEALYASLIIVMLVIVSQELLRIQINGLDHYVPFTRVSGSVGAGSARGGGGGLW